MLTTVRSNQRGFTLVEVTIILLVLVILSMIMLPQLGQFNRLARKVKAFEDIGAICAVLKMFVDDVGFPFFEEPNRSVAPTGPGSTTTNAASADDATGGRVGLLVGPGAIPSLATAVDDAAKNNTVAGTWGTDLATDITVATDIGTPAPVIFDVDVFSRHLIQNAPTDGNGLTAATGRYPNQVDDPTIGFFSGWHGPYMNEFTPDPWQQRYMANVFGLHTAVNGSTYSTGVVCISAGPNARIETRLNQPMAAAPPGWVTGGDDIAAILSSFGPF